MVEPVQGEGGVRVASTEFLQALRALCDEHGLLLVLDEVQMRHGPYRQAVRLRVGRHHARHHGGRQGHRRRLPARAPCLATEEAAKGMTPGTHGSTFGGNPLAMAVGNAVLDGVLEPGFLDGVQQKALRLKQALAAHQGRASRTSSRRCAARAC